MAEKPLSAEFAILCDDVRQEFNGKQIFIGVYSEDIILNAFPAPLLLQAVIKFNTTVTGTYDVAMSVTSGQQVLMSGKGKFHTNKVGRGFTNFPIQLHFAEPCDIALKIQINNERKKTLLNLKVREREHESAGET